MKLIKIIFICFCSLSILHSQTPKEYSNGHGGKITLPLGDLSFCDKVIYYRPGNPSPVPENSKGNDALGAPNFEAQQVTGFVSLGIGGELCLSFTDNALVNIPGPDLCVFEVGRYVEETYLYVSKNGKKWINVGKISGGNTLVDIGDSTLPGDLFTYIKLVDAGTSLSRNDRMWPGADIDAVAAIGSAKQISLNALYLFDTNKFVLKPLSKSGLDSIVSELITNPGFDLVINGHTDSIGSAPFNQRLSLDRAEAIKKYILSKLPEYKSRIAVHGYSDDQPIESNSTAEGREKNRRVEVFFIPKK
ncbi:MAG: OmpA family protein [bacterium]|nr:OmpA family protein [bacterium]